MRVAVIADSHFSERSRFEECVRVHDFIADEIRAREVDLVVHTGDVYDAKSTPEERRAVARWVARCADVAPVLIVRGNHDAVGDLPLLERLRTRHQVIVEERAGTHTFDTPHGRIVVGALAWPQTARIAHELGHVSLEASGLAAGEALRAVVRGIGARMAECSEGVVRLFATHAMVRGSMTSTGQPLVGCDLEVSLDDLALANAHAIALGHIHKPQSWVVPDDCHTIYPGSPRRTSFGEVEAKGFVVLDFDGARLTSWQRVETPCARMLLVSATWAAGAMRWTGANQTPDLVGSLDGAEVRLRYTVEGDRRDEARAAARELEERWLAAGAALVKVEEEVVATQRARAPEIAAAVSIEDKLRALWARQGVEGERVERLLGRVKEVAA